MFFYFYFIWKTNIIYCVNTENKYQLESSNFDQNNAELNSVHMFIAFSMNFFVNTTILFFVHFFLVEPLMTCTHTPRHGVGMCQTHND